MVTAAERSANAGSVRFGIESAGHYHRALASTLRAEGSTSCELNPLPREARPSPAGPGALKTDLRDCLAMVELLVRGQGWPLHRADGADRRAGGVGGAPPPQSRRGAGSGQPGPRVGRCGVPRPDGLLHAPGWRPRRCGCCWRRLPTPAGSRPWTPRQLVAHAAPTACGCCGRRRPRSSPPLPRRCACPTPAHSRQPAARRRDRCIRGAATRSGSACDQRLAAAAAGHTGGVLTSIPGVGVVTASYYAAALGDRLAVR